MPAIQLLRRISQLFRAGYSDSDARDDLGLGTAATNDAGDFAEASHDHAASDIISGVLDPDRLASGTPDAGKYPDPVNGWTTIPTNSSGGSVGVVQVSDGASGFAASALSVTARTLIATGDLTLRQSGDVYGYSEMVLQNRVGSNGAMFKTQGLGGANLVDFGFTTALTTTVNSLRAEFRAGSCQATANGSTGEIQIYIDASGSPAIGAVFGKAVCSLFPQGESSGTPNGRVGIRTASPEGILHPKSTEAAVPVLVLENSPGQTAPTTKIQAHTESQNRDAAIIDAGFADATDATRQGFVAILASDWNISVNGGNREGIRVAADGTQAKIGFFGANPVARPATPVTLADVIAAGQALGLWS